MRALRDILAAGLMIGALLIVGACGGARPVDDSEDGPDQPEAPTGDVTLTTIDGLTIGATFVRAEGESRQPACLLVHMLGHDRSTYSDFQEMLSEAGINSLAIDMRGHGDSTQDGTVDLQDFDDAQWEAIENDLRAGLDYLRGNPNVDPGRIGIVGASIGANLAVVTAADEIVEGVGNPPKFLVLLSPGVTYHGIAPLPRGHDLEHMPVYVVSATEDNQSYRGALSMTQAARGSDDLYSFEGSDHGTDLFDAHPELPGDIVDWINNKLGGIVSEPEPESEASPEQPAPEND